MELTTTNDLQRLEGIIEKGIATFQEVGNALLEIKERGLYKDTHKTFKEYVEGRWGFSIRKAQYLIEDWRDAQRSPQVLTQQGSDLRTAHPDGAQLPPAPEPSRPLNAKPKATKEETSEPDRFGLPANPDRAKRLAAGRPIFDDRKIDDAWGKLTRAIDERAAAKGHKQAHERVQAALSEAFLVWKQVKRETSK